eukprot:scaffold1588_cov214-Alexandrium_tamarense.AAC.19
MQNRAARSNSHNCANATRSSGSNGSYLNSDIANGHVNGATSRMKRQNPNTNSRMERADNNKDDANVFSPNLQKYLSRSSADGVKSRGASSSGKKQSADSKSGKNVHQNQQNNLPKQQQQAWKNQQEKNQNTNQRTVVAKTRLTEKRGKSSLAFAKYGILPSNATESTNGGGRAIATQSSVLSPSTTAGGGGDYQGAMLFSPEGVGGELNRMLRTGGTDNNVNRGMDDITNVNSRNNNNDSGGKEEQHGGLSFLLSPNNNSQYEGDGDSYTVGSVLFSPGGMSWMGGKGGGGGWGVEGETGLNGNYYGGEDAACGKTESAAVDAPKFVGYNSNKNKYLQEQLGCSPPSNTNNNNNNPKTPINSINADSDSSSGEFFTPTSTATKTPTKTPSKSTPKGYSGGSPATLSESLSAASYSSYNNSASSKQFLPSSSNQFGTSAGGGGTGGLAPVWEDENDDGKYQQQQYQEQYDTEKNEPSVVFVTPNQQGIYLKTNSNDGEDSDEDEFFSPLAQYSQHTPSNKHQHISSRQRSTQQQRQHASKQLSTMLAQEAFFNLSPISSSFNHNNVSVLSMDVDGDSVENESYPLICEVKNMLAGCKWLKQPVSGEGGVQTEVVTLENTDKAVQASTTVASPNYSEVREECQSLLKEARDLSNTSTEVMESMPESAPSAPVESSNAPLAPKVHDLVPSLPPGALSVEFVRHCNSVKTLENILSVLQNNDNNKRGKQLRQPFLVRLVQKRMEKVNPRLEVLSEVKEMSAIEQSDEEHWEQFTGAKELKTAGKKGKHVVWSEDVKENVESVSSANQGASSLSLPMKSILLTVSHFENSTEHDGMEVVGNLLPLSAAPSSPSRHETASLMTYESSLDMNLSESVFTLEEESAYWKQSAEDGLGEVFKVTMEEVEAVSVMDNAAQPSESEAVVVGNGASLSNEEELNVTHFAELTEELAETLTSHARLTEELESLVHSKARLSSKLDEATQQLSQQHTSASEEKAMHLERISQLLEENKNLRKEVGSLRSQIQSITQKAEASTARMQSQLEEALRTHSKLIQEKDTIGSELNNARMAYDEVQKEVARSKMCLDEVGKQKVSIGCLLCTLVLFKLFSVSSVFVSTFPKGNGG